MDEGDRHGRIAQALGRAPASPTAALQARFAALEAARAEVVRLYARWAELETKQA